MRTIGTSGHTLSAVAASWVPPPAPHTTLHRTCPGAVMADSTLQAQQHTQSDNTSHPSQHAESLPSSNPPVHIQRIRRSKQKQQQKQNKVQLGEASLASLEAAGVNQGVTYYMLHLFGLDSMQQWYDKAVEREKDKMAVDQYVRDKTKEPTSKQHRRCEYVHTWRRTIFSCPRCWMLPGLCVCQMMKTYPCPTQVIVHMHHSEWGKCSNTGCVAPLTYPGQSKVLLRGYKPHDDELQALFDDPTITTAVLWPGEHAVLPDELKAIAEERTGGRIAVVAVDASWDGAMRMQRRYPKSVLQVKLSPESALRGQDQSLLYPVRKYRGDLESNGRVCTMEAVAVLLHELHGDDEQLAGTLENLKVKVDAMLVQKLRPPVYGTVAAGFPEIAKKAAAERAASAAAHPGLCSESAGNAASAPHDLLLKELLAGAAD